jgi:hypothetical protein
MRGLGPPGAGMNRVNAAFIPCVQRNGFQISYIWYLKIWNNFIKVNGSCECKLSGLLLCAVQGSSSFTLYFGDPSMHWRGNTTHSQLASRPDAFDASTSACSILPKYRVGILISLIVKIFYKRCSVMVCSGGRGWSCLFAIFLEIVVLCWAVGLKPLT